MFLDFFLKLKNEKIPVSLNEFFIFLSALDRGVPGYDVEKFYYLAKSCLIKNEKNIDKFDLVFSEFFNAIERIDIVDFFEKSEISNEWLKKLYNKYFTKEEINKIKSLGGFKKLMETLKKRIEEQKTRHQGGNKWIGTSGTSPFGAYGYNPEGIRIGQEKSIHRKAVKVWDKRLFKNFDDSAQLDNRGMQVALKKLRHWARTGVEYELDIENTIHDTAKNGFLDIKTRKEKENSIKVLLFLDVGGSMDIHVEKVERLFSATRNVFKNLEYFYFHNCLYENIWKNNERRWEEKFSTLELFRTYGKDYKCIFVGDASMSPYEILSHGGGNEHFNEETGKVWLERAINQWPSYLWINPLPKKYWHFSESTNIINTIFLKRMVTLSLKGIEQGIKFLTKKN